MQMEIFLFCSGKEKKGKTPPQHFFPVFVAIQATNEPQMLSEKLRIKLMFTVLL